jgi:F-type H+-transporting ATPase subunit b
MEALGINLGYLFVQIIAFIVIYALLSRWLYDPLSRMLSERRMRIAKGLEDAAAAANARRNAEAEGEKIIASARAEAGKLIEEARGRADDVAKQVQAEANTEADKIRTDARAAASAERDQQLAGLRGQVAAISIAVAQKLIGEALDQKRQQALIDDFFAKVPDSARKLGGQVEVVSAMPLSDAEQAKAKEETGAAEISFKVDPTILGGLIVRSGDRVVDGSVRSGLNDLANHLS